MTPSLVVFRPTWGLLRDDDGYLSMAEFIQHLVGSEYGGVECSVATVYKQDHFVRLVKEHNLQWVLSAVVGCDLVSLICSSDSDRVYIWPNWERILRTGLVDRIPSINCFTGHDSMLFAAGVQLIQSMHEWYRSDWTPRLPAGVAAPLLLHETHRGRLLYSPWITVQYVRAISDLYLVADFSHWTCVAEFDADPEPDQCSPDSLQRNLLHESIQFVIERVRHVQGRVGYSQGPQVPDPRHPKWQRQLRLFESWWDASLQHQIRIADRLAVTFTPEHGPVPYQQEIGDLDCDQLLLHVDQVNHFLAQRQRQRFREFASC